MLKRQFLLVIVIISMSLASPVVSNINARALSLNREAAGDFYQRHPDWTVAFQAQTPYHLDCFRRNYNIEKSAIQEQDATNYFLNVS
jgi:hypothetical protein